MLKSVITALDSLIGIQKALILSAEDKKAALIGRQADDLNRLVKEEAKLVKQLEGAEAERVRLVEELLVANPSMSFHAYAEGLPDGQEKQQLQLKMKTLQQLTIELQDKNKVNERLLKDSMSFVQHMIGQITKSQQQNYNYQSPAGQQKSQTSSRGFFDTKA